MGWKLIVAAVFVFLNGVLIFLTALCAYGGYNADISEPEQNASAAWGVLTITWLLMNIILIWMNMTGVRLSPRKILVFACLINMIAIVLEMYYIWFPLRALLMEDCFVTSAICLSVSFFFFVVLRINRPTNCSTNCSPV